MEKIMLKLKRVVSLPPFPKNDAGLQRGTILEALDEAVSILGLTVGNRIVIGFDGDYICCGPFSWDIAQLTDEISEGIWSIKGTIDLTDPRHRMEFHRLIEGLELVN